MNTFFASHLLVIKAFAGSPEDIFGEAGLFMIKLPVLLVRDTDLYWMFRLEGGTAVTIWKDLILSAPFHAGAIHMNGVTLTLALELMSPDRVTR